MNPNLISVTLRPPIQFILSHLVTSKLKTTSRLVRRKKGDEGEKGRREAKGRRIY